MSILSDKQIRKLSMPPSFVVKRNIPQQQSNSHDIFLSPYSINEFSWEDEQTIEDRICQFNRNRQFAIGEPIGIYGYRKVTPEDLKDWKPMIEPFSPDLVRELNEEKIVSYGTSSYGYDIRCGREFKIFTNINSTVVDPKNFDERNYVDHVGDYCIIPPNSFALARTMEYFRIPRNILTVCLGKSTYARCGIIVNVTPFEPEWEGHVTLEFSNTTPLPAKIYAGEGCAQVLFFMADEECETSYKDRNGKYQA